MSIIIVSQGRDVTPWIEALKAKRPELEVNAYPEAGLNDDVDFALAWNHPLGVFKEFPNLKCIASMGAGVDHILKDPELPTNAVITRVTNENLTKDMATFNVALVMNHIRGLSNFKVEESAASWKPAPYLRPEDVTVGVMGMGVLGTHTALQLKQLGFNVQGWARSSKNLEGIHVFSDNSELDTFLATSNVLICLLPLTPDTVNILNKRTFGKLPQNAFVINVARGEHLVEDDLIEMIDNGHLAGASLDVFRTEPLPANHRFWAHPKINVTPHIASVTDPASAVSQILENYDRVKRNESLINVVSRTKGY
jgi:glyoxylate/hydroxypyruvate reductase